MEQQTWKFKQKHNDSNDTKKKKAEIEQSNKKKLKQHKGQINKKNSGILQFQFDLEKGRKKTN